MTTRMLAGQPGSPAGIGLPGTARLVRTTAAATRGTTVYLHGVVEDRSTLAHGESAHQSFELDRARKQLRAVIAGTGLSLPLSEVTGS